jgi:CheY-like chemotaxis protein
MTGLVTHLRARAGGRRLSRAAGVPNLIILDLPAPEVSGFDVVTALNEYPRRPVSPS